MGPIFAPASDLCVTFEVLLEGNDPSEAGNIYQALSCCGRLHIKKGTLGMKNATVLYDGDVFYFLVSCTNCSNLDNAKRCIRKMVNEIGYDVEVRTFATIKHIKVFTKVSLCRFGWEPISKKDVEEAVKEEDHNKLMAIMPEAKELIMRDDLQHLPAIYDMLHGTKAIANSAYEEHEAYKEVTAHIHKWFFKQGLQCHYCGRPSFKACDCGKVLCNGCCACLRLPKYVWSMQGDGCIFVYDYANMPVEDKLEWVKLKIGEGADLDVFAKTYVQLFADKVGIQSQKSLCLKLYREYAEIANTEEQGSYKTLAEARSKAYSCESQIPPRERQDFQRVWDENAPARCLECNDPIPDGYDFCCKKHQYAGAVRVCGRPCGSKSSGNELADAHGKEVILRCQGKVLEVHGIFVCQDCGHNKEVAAEVAAREEKWKNLASGSSSSTEREKGRNNARGITAAVANMFSIKSQDPTHMPSWTSRKRNADSVPLGPVKRRK